MTAVCVRKAEPSDFSRLVDILSQNEMFNFPEVDGPEAMLRVCKNMGNYFLVAESKGVVVGMIRGCYDGSRALIHQMVVDKNYQRQGIGTELLSELSSFFKSAGAVSVAVTVTENSKSYYKKMGFHEVPVKLMIQQNIDSLLH